MGTGPMGGYSGLSSMQFGQPGGDTGAMSSTGSNTSTMGGSGTSSAFGGANGG